MPSIATNSLPPPPQRRSSRPILRLRSTYITCCLGSLLGIVLVAVNLSAQNVTLQTAPGGITITGNFNAGFGKINGLGVGTAPTGTTVITTGVSGGVLYTTPYNIVISGVGGGNPAVVKAYVSTNFTHPTILILESCYPSSSCTGAGSYTVLSTSSASPTVVIPQPGISNNSTVTASLALFVSNADGSGTFTGADSATITYNIYNGSNMQLQHTETLTLNTPSETVQTAVELMLATAPSGVTISPGSDFSINFGNVNGLGLSPGANLTAVSGAGGVTYGTPYLYQPSFSSFTSTTCSLKVYVSTNFAHPNTLTLRDATALAGPYTNISTSVGSQTAITTTAASGSSNTRYLGLFVSSANGAGAFPGTAGASGADSATLTYTLTVP